MQDAAHAMPRLALRSPYADMGTASAFGLPPLIARVLGTCTEPDATADAYSVVSSGPPCGDRFVSRRLAELAWLQAGWNGYDAVPPSKAAIRRATAWIEAFRQRVLQSHGSWWTPNVTASAEGEVVFEWWAGPRKLTVYVDSEVTTYVKSWGPRIDTEMEDGCLSNDEEERRVWQWLVA